MGRRYYNRGRRKRRSSYGSRNKRMSKEEQWMWGIAIFIAVSAFIVYFVWGVITNCIFEWPIRWDFGTCWDEQKTPATEKAIDAAAPFVPL